MHLPRAASASVVALAIVVGAMGFSIATSPVAQAAPTPINITSGSCPSVIKQGQKSGCVVDLQNKLNAKGYSPGTPDGDFGPNTLSAVKAFQKGVGLDPDGLVGSNTKAALNNTKQYSVTFNNNGVSTDAVKTITKSYGTKITLPSASSTAAKAFKGWCVDKSPCPSSHAGGSAYVVTGNVTMYAQWATRSYTLTFEANGVPGTVPGKQTKPYGTKISAPEMKPPDDSGVTFKGWCAAKSCDRPWRTGDPITLTSDLKLYAQATFTSLRVSYNLNGGPGKIPTGESRIYGAVITLPSMDSTTAQAFKGWCEGSKPCSKPLAGGSKYTIKTDKTLFAQWLTKSYALTFDLNKGPGTAPDKQTKPYGTTVSLPGMTPPDGSGVTFRGWCAGATSCDRPWRAGDPLTVTGDLKLYAQWTFTYLRVSYNLNGGPGTTPQGDQRLWGTVITLPMMDSDAYHTFRGWCEGPTACTKPLAGKSSYTLVKDVTFYAQWLTKSYTLTFDGNNGQGTVPDAQTKPYGTKVSLPGMTPPNGSCATFRGWCAGATSCDRPWRAGDPLTVTGDLRLYAQWAHSGATSISIAPGPTATVGQNGAVWLTATVAPAWTTDTMVTWRADDAGLVMLQPAQNLEEGRPAVVVYAHARLGATTVTATTEGGCAASVTLKVVSEVSFNSNARGGSLPTQTAEAGQTIALPKSYPGADAGVLRGWCAGASTCVAPLAPGASYKPTGSVIMYAQWTVTVTFGANGGTGTVPKTETVPVPSTTKIKLQSMVSSDGRLLWGWCEGQTTCDKPLSPGSEYAPRATTTLYAQWAGLNQVPVGPGRTVTAPYRHIRAPGMGVSEDGLEYVYSRTWVQWVAENPWANQSTVVFLGALTAACVEVAPVAGPAALACLSVDMLVGAVVYDHDQRWSTAAAHGACMAEAIDSDLITRYNYEVPRTDKECQI